MAVFAGTTILLAIMFGVVCFLFWLVMLVDCLKHTPETGGARWGWVAVIFFLQLLGALLYYFIQKPQNELLT